MSENMIACNLTFEDINKLAERVENGKLSKIKIKNGNCEIVIEKESKILPPPLILQRLYSRQLLLKLHQNLHLQAEML